MPPSHASPCNAAGIVFVTGATGFIGRAVAAALARAGHQVVCGARSLPSQAPPGGERWVAYGEVGPDTHWEQALAGIGTLVHLAGLAHLPDETAAAAAETFQRVNVEGTARLAAAARAAGVRRFVLMSSVLAQASDSRSRPLTEQDAARPEGAYARSKLESELRLKEIASGTDMEWVILRPPMVYGPGVAGNFRRLVKLVPMGLPLPVGGATAPRSFIAIDNLASAVVRCVEHPLAAGETFLVSDAETSSTLGLVRAIADALGRRVWTPSVPPFLLRAALSLIGRERDFRRLFDPLEIDSSRIRERLGWQPPISMAEGVRRAVVPQSNAGSIGTR